MLNLSQRARPRAPWVSCKPLLLPHLHSTLQLAGGFAFSDDFHRCLVCCMVLLRLQALPALLQMSLCAFPCAYGVWLEGGEPASFCASVPAQICHLCLHLPTRLETYIRNHFKNSNHSAAVPFLHLFPNPHQHCPPLPSLLPQGYQHWPPLPTLLPRFYQLCPPLPTEYLREPGNLPEGRA